MSILLTGGTGYIGSHTCVNLLKSGDEVVIVDNFVNSKPDVLEKIERITHKRPTFYEADVCDPVAMEDVFAREEIASVIHFAGLKAVGESVQKPLLYYRTNLDSTLTLLETMERHNVFKLVFSSSATVYGRVEKSPITEDAPLGCSNPYGWTKYMIEQILSDLAASDPRWSIALLRYFNPVGAHESGLIGEDPNGIPNNLMPNVLNVAAGNPPVLKINGGDYPTVDGTCIRDYIHVMDLAQGHSLALNFINEHTGAHAFNLGTGVGYSVLNIVNTFERATGVEIPYVISERRPGDVPSYFANPEKAQRLLGWKAEKTLEDMCRDAWRFKNSAVSNK